MTIQCLEIITDLVMAVRILDKDITQVDTGITMLTDKRRETLMLGFTRYIFSNIFSML